ncbi:MAG: carboxypeptidase-like regulatory domain-containing protein [Halobacteriota archaeon]|nr:carboxypeptidase-like regulatory domain-containing protein [Halobacteriota archaeon]
MRYEELAWILLVILLIGIVSADTGPPHSIYGYVYSGSNPLPGANVVASNTRTGESLNITTADDGHWIIQLANLPSGYEDGDEIAITATSDGDFENTIIIVDTSVGFQKADNLTLTTDELNSNHPTDNPKQFIGGGGGGGVLPPSSTPTPTTTPTPTPKPTTTPTTKAITTPTLIPSATTIQASEPTRASDKLIPSIILTGVVVAVIITGVILQYKKGPSRYSLTDMGEEALEEEIKKKR